jgi:hypothetical protein
MDSGYPDLTNLHRWPYTINDNPNTVIEPTTRCNLSCPGCYRITNLAHGEHRQKSLEDMKTYIDDVIRLRNTSCLSFLGGEPLLHPQLTDAIAYAKQKGLNVGVYSNGLLLTEPKLAEFRELGVSYVFVHVDKHQGRGDTEEEINKVRQHFCDMFRRVGRVQMGFSFQFQEKDIPDVDKIVGFFTSNADVVKMLNFALCTNAPEEGETAPAHISHPEQIEEIDAVRYESQKKMYKAIEDAYGLTWSAYLGTKFDEKLPGKISSLCAYHNGKFLGSVDSEVVRNKSERARRASGKFPYIEKIPLSSSPMDIKYLLFNKSIRQIYFNLWKRLGLKVDWQFVSVSFSPLMRKEGLNYCESCTDAVLHNGEFTPMCALEHIIESETRPCAGQGTSM